MLHLYTALTAYFASREEKGATATEYALIIAVIALVLIGVMSAFGSTLQGFWNRLSSSLPA